MIAEEIAEFIDSPLPGLSLFVQSRWSAGLPEKLPEGADSVLCELLACDGLRCWEGVLRRHDLSGPLGESWGKQSNLQLLLDALAGRNNRGLAAVGSHGTASLGSLGVGGDAVPFTNLDTLPIGEAVWTCSEDSSLGLTIRFIYREGPVIAVRGVRLLCASLSAGLSKFFALACGAQDAAFRCVSEAESECAELQTQHESLQRRLETLPKESDAEDDRILKEMAHILNNQKARCRKLWEAGWQAGGGDGDRPDVDVITVRLDEPATISLTECLDREPPVPEANNPPSGAAASGLDLSAPSLVFASESFQDPPLSAEARKDANDFTFTIPLTLGMGDCGNPSFRASSKRAATVENLLGPATIRRRIDAP